MRRTAPWLVVLFVSSSPSPSVRGEEVSFERVVIDAGGPRNPWVKIVGDFNGDGLPDIVIGGQDGPLVWYEQPSWKKRVVAEGGYQSVDGECGDIDGDGDLDLAVAGCWFETPADVSSGRWTRRVYSSAWTRGDAKVAVADLDGDGRLDVVLSPAEPRGETDRIAWFEAPSDRTTTEWPQRVIQRDVEAVVHALAVGDVDGDGALDVVTAEMHQGADPDEVVVHLGRAGGTRWERRVVATTGSHNIVLVDIDRDGDLDIVGANHGGPHQAIELWRNGGEKGERE